MEGNGRKLAQPGNSAFFNLDTDTPRLMAVALGNLSTRPYFEDETGRICWENEPTSSD